MTHIGGPYVGRFAPSPSGPLHFGSLLAAVGSYLQARAAHGRWLLRIEDLDRPRVVAGAADRIVHALAAFGFEWDGPIEYQSRRLDQYSKALDSLRAAGRIYACTCSRARIAAWHARQDGAEVDELRYPGICREHVHAFDGESAFRFHVREGHVDFIDRIQGPQSEDVAQISGDFVVRRRDGIHAYHLAVVIDDAAQGITEVVRGADLLDSTSRHILLQRALGVPTPAYCHLPVALDLSGRKLSKSTQSLSVDPAHAAAVLCQTLVALRQSPPPALKTGDLREIWEWAIRHWNLQPLRRLLTCAAPSAMG